MSVPALDNGPWTFNVNNDCSEPVLNDTKRHSIWQLKECLKGFSAWSVIASSDSVSVKNIGDASPDLWSAWSNVVGANPGTAHSWIILENSVTGEQICFDTRGTSYQTDVVWSQSGAFNTDGSITNRPTASESQDLCVSSTIVGSSGDGAVVHAMISNDDKCTRWSIHSRDNSSNGDWFGMLEEVVNTPSVWTGTFKRAGLAIQSTALSTANTSKSPQAAIFGTTTAAWRAYLADATPYEGWNTCNSTAECWGSFSSDGGRPFFKNGNLQGWLGGFPVSAIGLYRTLIERGGSLGRFQDIYWAHEYHNTYDTYDGVGSREWIKIGGFMLPWNGTQPLEVP